MDKRAIVFDIQRASFVDGTGIRTTIFFKGCNLRCKWCHNPEGLDGKIQLLKYKDKCTDCKKCEKICLNGKKSCTLCGKCAIFCPNDALELCGKEYTAQELLDIVLKDKDFYVASGGGVTLSGGECMLQGDVISSLLKLCKENGIHTAIDTAGNVPWKAFEAVLPYTDLFLYDVKCASEDLHIKGTGVSNKLILENLRRISATGKDIFIRIPIIGSFNDFEDELYAIKELLKDINYRKIELLPYHSLGEHKYDVQELEFVRFTTPSGEYMERFEKIFKN